MNQLEIATIIKDELLTRKLVNYAEIDENFVNKNPPFMYPMLIYFNSEPIKKYTTWRFKDHGIELEACPQCIANDQQCMDCIIEQNKQIIEKDWIVTNQYGWIKCSKCQKDNCEHIQFINKGIDYNSVNPSEYPYGYYPYTKRITIHRTIKYIPNTRTSFRRYSFRLFTDSFNIAPETIYWKEFDEDRRSVGQWEELTKEMILAVIDKLEIEINKLR